ncbi:MAG TPA: hypothetical protein VE986_03100, partial [Hyphomicrobiales bacterium]|nr:hypothetical protein [Hyphomicrobiales bacterium]
MRYSIVLFCLAAFTSAAGAHPRPVEKPQPFFTVIFVQDGDNRFGEADGAERKAAVANNCRSDPEGYNRPECLRYLRKAKPQISNAKSKREQTPPPPAKQATAKAQSRGESEQSDKRLANFVGQLLLAGFDGKEPVDPEVMRVAGALHDGALSGVFIRSSNVANAAQLRRLLGSLQHETKDKPPLIAIEQPGGPDSTLSEEKGFTYFASANVVASHANPYEAQLVYREMAGELAALGVTLNIGASADTCPEQGVSLS